MQAVIPKAKRGVNEKRSRWAFVGTNPENAANFCTARRSGGISAIDRGKLPRRRLLSRVDGSSPSPKRSDPDLTREQLLGQAKVPFEFEFALIMPLHEKEIFQQLRLATRSTFGSPTISDLVFLRDDVLQLRYDA
jgi:hypothetical protein